MNAINVLRAGRSRMGNRNWIVAIAAALLHACGGGGTTNDNGAAAPAAGALTVTITASPANISSGSATTLSWSSTNSNTCVASGAWTGSRATSGSQSSGTLTATASYALICTGAGGSTSASATVAVTPISTTPTVTLTANPTSVTSGGTATLSWSSTNVSACTASGGWTGSRGTSGTASTGALSATTTYTLNCTGGGASANASTTLAVTSPPVPGAIHGLEWPGNGAVHRMLYWHNPFPIYDATYVFRVYPRKQPVPQNPNGYYTTFFWGNDGTFIWDLPDMTKVIRTTVDDVSWAAINPPTPSIVIGQAPNLNGASWGGYPGWEEFNGIIRGIQIYSGLLSVNDILAEIATPRSTTAGNNLIWYLNINPRPGDVTDKKGTGTPHNPS